MPANPLVVFFKKSEAKGKPLPVGFGENGTGFDPTQDKEKALLIILDDEVNQIPQLKHTNKDKGSPLPVIWHNVNDTKEQGLKCYGQPEWVAGFSHVTGNDISDSVLKLLTEDGDNALAVPNFVAKWRQVCLRRNFTELAAVIQCLVLLELQPQTELRKKAYSHYVKLLGYIPQELSTEVQNHVNNPTDLLAALNAIQNFASQDMSRSVQ